jgi:hypothetical protein
MRKIKLYNFQNLEVETTCELSSISESLEDENILRVVVVRDPYTFLDVLLLDYLKTKKSKLFTQDIINMMKKTKPEAFVEWLHSLNFMPFYNPQTMYFNKSQNIDIACSVLEKFDYVVPYEELELFLKNIDFDINLQILKEHKLLFTFKSQKENPIMNNFLEKDLKLYEKTWVLWEQIKRDRFRPINQLTGQ